MDGLAIIYSNADQSKLVWVTAALIGYWLEKVLPLDSQHKLSVVYFLSATYFDITVGHHQALQIVRNINGNI